MVICMPRKRLTEAAVEKLKPTPDKQIDYFDAGMPGLMLRVSYGGTKTWRALYYVNRKPKTHKLGRYPVLNLKQARDAARAFLADPQTAKRRSGTGTFKSVAEKFLELHVTHNRLRSKREIERCLTKYIYPAWEDRPFIELRRGDVADLLDDIVKNHGARQADAVLAIIRKIMHWYETRTDIYSSPIVRGMHRTNHAERKRQRVLSPDEIRALWSAADDLGSFGAFVKMLLLTGQRRDKVAKMKWTDINDDVWHLATEPREKGNPGSLKLPSMAIGIIGSQPRLAENPYVFAASVGNGPINSFSQRKKELENVLSHTIRDMPPWVLHDLRRTARTLMSKCVSPHIAERVLGHAIAGIEGVYDRHKYDEEKAEALERLASAIEEIVFVGNDRFGSKRSS